MTSAEEPPGTLDESVDWMTYPHAELYRMVHEGLDLAGATSVSADWARMGEALGEIGDELTKIVQAFADAWQGDAAEQAQHAVSSLGTWAQETGQRALSVSGCITVEVDNAMHARNTMPPPVPAEPMPHPWPKPKPKPMPLAADATVASSADFGSAPALLTDQTMIVGQRREAHQRAAETMERFQASSLEVYNTVPQFSPPKIGPKPPGEDNPPAPPPRPDQPPAPQPAPGPAPRPPASGGRGGGSVAVRGGGGVPGGAPPVASAPAEPRLGAGPGAGVREVPPSEARPAAASAGKTPGGGGSGMAGMPMGMGAGQKQEDQEHKRKQRIKEDSDIWGLRDEPTSPPVIGEGKPRA